MKKLLLSIAFLLTILLTINLVKAVGPLFTFNYPVNASTIYPEVGATHNFTITLNESVQTCDIIWGNNNTFINLTAISAANISWKYDSWYPRQNGAWRDIRYKCGNTTKYWSNDTVGVHRYRLKDASYTILEKVIVNNSILNAIPGALNITMASNENATNCTFFYNNVQADMSQSPTREFWSNTSELGWSDSAFGTYHNISYNCTDSCDNRTASGVYRFKLDTAVPTFPGTPTFTLVNHSSGGNKLLLTFNVSDKNPLSCQVRLVYSDGTIINASGEVDYNASIENYNCSFNVTPSDISKDGYVDVTPTALDDAGNRNTSPTTQSWIMYRLKTGWNLVTSYENKTLAGITAEFKNVSYVSVWDNINKSFSTFTTGSATNANIRANFTSKYSAGASYIYVAADVTSMRRYYTPPTTWLNTTLYYNSSAERTSWNIVAITKMILDANATIAVNDTCADYATGNLTYGPYCGNITWVAWWDIQNGEFCSFYRNRLSAGCNYRSNQINLTRGDAVWIAVQPDMDKNLTLMRGSW